MNLLSLSGATKTVIAGALAGGILVTGITWQGDGDVTNIKGNVDELTGKLTTAISDNEFLTNQFTNLKGLYTGAVATANDSISALNQSKEELLAQVAGLQADLTAKQAELDKVLADGSADAQAQAEAKDELQAEINRLEVELDKANQAIAELNAYIADANNSVQYTAVDRDAYAVTELDITDVSTATPAPTEPTEPTPTEPIVEPEPTPEEVVTEPVSFVSAEALALNSTFANNLADETRVNSIESGFYAKQRVTFDITGVTVYNYVSGGQTYPKMAYVLDITAENLSLIGTPAPSEAYNAITESNSGTSTVMYFVDNTGKLLFTINSSTGAVVKS